MPRGGWLGTAYAVPWVARDAGEPTADEEFHIDPATYFAGLSEVERTMRVELAEATLTGSDYLSLPMAFSVSLCACLDSFVN